MFRKFEKAESVLITGGSSGIGEALAVACARRGVSHVFFCGRDAARVASVEEKCRNEAAACGKSVEAHGSVIDVTDADAMRAWIEKCDSVAQIEVVFANAGIGTGRETEENVRRTFATNIGGSMNAVLPAIDVFRKRAQAEGGKKARRQIAITASIAGYAPLSTCPSYAATKAAMKSWGLSLRGMLKREGIAVNVVCPGFVRSRITERNTCPMPFFMEADKAAETILDRLDANCGLITFPWQMRFGVWFMSVLPWRLSEALSRILPEKNAENRHEGGGIAF